MNKKQALLTASGVLTFILVVAGIAAGCPVYNVWQKEMSGKAQLAEAEGNRQIAIREAQAKMESARYESDSEIERARGVSEANKIIGDSLKGNEAYLRYLWIMGLQIEKNQVIYVPTEANLPILEAGKR